MWLYLLLIDFFKTEVYHFHRCCMKFFTDLRADNLFIASIPACSNFTCLNYRRTNGVGLKQNVSLNSEVLP